MDVEDHLRKELKYKEAEVERLTETINAIGVEVENIDRPDFSSSRLMRLRRIRDIIDDANALMEGV